MTPSNKVAIKTLAEYFKANLDDVTILEEWPDPKVELKMPCISIMSVGKNALMNTFPKIHKKVAAEGEPEHIKKVVYIVGQYDQNIQVDLWTDYKAKRDELYERVMAVLDRQFVDSSLPSGLSLELVDYHETFARYDQTGYAYMDSSENAQIQEWRAKIDLLATYPRLVEKTESIMAEITLKHGINETIDVETDITDEEIVLEQE